MFPVARVEWTNPQEQLVKWLRYYDMFYEYCSMQETIVETEPVTPEMVECDLLVDAFITWYEWKAEQKKEERKKERDAREEGEAQVPEAREHPEVFRAAHR